MERNIVLVPQVFVMLLLDVVEVAKVSLLKLTITAKVISSVYDLIIGLLDICRYNLLNYFRYKFCANVVPDRSQNSIWDSSQRHGLVQ